MEKLDLLYEGKAKRVYKTDDPRYYIIEYKDEATAFDGKKKGIIQGKGTVNNKVSAVFFQLLEENGVPTHFVELLSPTEMLVKRVEIIPLEVIVRNYAAGSISRRLGLEEGIKFDQPIVEFCYKNDELGDPMVNNYHILAMKLANEEEINALTQQALRINQILSQFLLGKNIILVDFKLEFGRTDEGDIVLADEISPDTCRFWDSATMEKLDKDRFRRDMGGVEEAYMEIARRLGCV
ncbi:MAG TPA: phosphoribosylaminoimidazolesuccinocarboxamide synthase [Coprothermobacter proteolyticus]|uniref:Phosphoribosylaminoimidazole-succinocarboxamide synthase n=1 Tax=Coprothermobacter proteolyticus (strain ATCC 35245 / DSM 5265 / OCM 4 / BT) TaxID=309798 RepID=PUR7_COPPD|nr:phosphoribosylaminoimidazolesuccinocarboxamide synthase [Coprothermobacter proteolyticus]B5Y714.1 RecName: Full=Phosphoribosylaminoimidazole-succinocarboxamide synthase; AltName: Full=SAICAR synthetase [Coprothermobacter proteolyticus DSM 5265]ACI17914.1 phosphoribosylaminoimidazole-succinocarboxamide synthase [Coprothermobacter proteolyticus DSM 5265]HOL53407.1 phosphoribosylaminoimidazolesuccinocarboxamide synthase [Coprothermobacter proteolyticus]